MVDIELSDWPVVGDGDAENKSDSGWFHHGTNGFMVVNSRALVESFRYKPGLEPIYRAISMSFDRKDPLAAENICMMKRRDYIPCVIAKLSIKLLIHCFTPPRILESLSNCGGDSFCI